MRWRAVLTPYVATRRITLIPVDPPLEGAAIRALLAEDDLAEPDDVDVFQHTFPGDGQADTTQFLIHRPDIERTVGFAALSELDLDRGGIQVHVLAKAVTTPHGMGLEATVLLVNYAFAVWPIEQVYFPVRAKKAGHFNLPAIISENAVLPDHLRRQKPSPELKVFSIHRDPWLKYGTKLLARLQRSPSEA
jgi:hypothetical protein